MILQLMQIYFCLTGSVLWSHNPWKSTTEIQSGIWHWFCKSLGAICPLPHHQHCLSYVCSHISTCSSIMFLFYFQFSITSTKHLLHRHTKRMAQTSTSSMGQENCLAICRLTLWALVGLRLKTRHLLRPSVSQASLLLLPSLMAS